MYSFDQDLTNQSEQADRDTPFFVFSFEIHISIPMDGNLQRSGFSEGCVAGSGYQLFLQRWSNCFSRGLSVSIFWKPITLVIFQGVLHDHPTPSGSAHKKSLLTYM